MEIPSDNRSFFFAKQTLGIKCLKAMLLFDNIENAFQIYHKFYSIYDAFDRR